jgi:thymidylate synthase (FAD)
MDAELSAGAVEAIQTAWTFSYKTYQALLAQGVAREMARSVLPVSMYTTFVWKVDLWNLFHFLDLRMDLHAQEQIRVYAEAIHTILQDLAPEALSAFDTYIRNAVTLTHTEVMAIRAAVTAGSPLATAEVETENRRERSEWYEKRTALFGEEPADA